MSLPEKPGMVAKTPVRPDPAISALLAAVAGGSVQVMHNVPMAVEQPLNPAFDTVMLPAMLKLPDSSGAAGKLAHINPPSTIASRTLHFISGSLSLRCCSI